VESRRFSTPKRIPDDTCPAATRDAAGAHEWTSRASERFQILDEIRLLRWRQFQIKQLVVAIDNCPQVGCAAIVKVRRMLYEPPQRRGPTFSCRRPRSLVRSPFPVVTTLQRCSGRSTTNGCGSRSPVHQSGEGSNSDINATRRHLSSSDDRSLEACFVRPVDARLKVLSNGYRFFCPAPRSGSTDGRVFVRLEACLFPE
jgi:hypothetical protein